MFLAGWHTSKGRRPTITLPPNVHSDDGQTERQSPAGCEFYALARRALQAYGLGANAGIELLRTTNNAVFKITLPAGDRYALRVHRPGYRHPDQTRSELQFVSMLHQATDLNVPEAIPTRDGDLVAWLDGDVPRHCSLLRWLDGEVHRPGSGLGRRSSYRLGEALATMHSFAERFEPPAGLRLPTWDAAGLFSEESAFGPNRVMDLLSPEARAMFGAIAERTRVLFEQLGRGREQFGVIHADFILGNCRWHGRSLRILDFDDCGWGYFLYDLAPVMGNLDDFGATLLQAELLRGYRSLRPLPRECEEHLPLLMAARHADVLVWLASLLRSGQGNVDVPRQVAARVEGMRHYIEGSSP